MSGRPEAPEGIETPTFAVNPAATNDTPQAGRGIAGPGRGSRGARSAAPPGRPAGLISAGAADGLSDERATAEREAYDAVRRALAPSVEPLATRIAQKRQEAAARRLETYRAEERAVFAELDNDPEVLAARAAVAAEKAYAAARHAPAASAGLFRSVLGISDPAPSAGEWTGSEFGKETQSFRERTAQAYELSAEVAALEGERSGRLASWAHRRALALEAEAADDAPAIATWEGEGGPGLDGDRAGEWSARAVEFAELAKDARASEKWHRDRALGERERCERVDACGASAMEMHCQPRRWGCGAKDVRLHSCQVGRLCASCRAREAAHARRRFGEGRMRAIEKAERRGLFRHQRPGGRWSEKFGTFTAPHITGENDYRGTVGRETAAAARLRIALETETGDSTLFRERLKSGPAYGEANRAAALRVQLLFDAWRYFSLELQDWCRDVKKRTGIAPVHHRSFEWTPGADGLGHPHFHVVFLCPFLDWKMLDEWWTKALRRAGYTGEAAPTSPDIREIKSNRAEIARELHKGNGAKLRFTGRGGQDAHDYACGWSIAEWAEGEERASVATVARLYESLHRRQLTRATDGFLSPRPQGCSLCGALGAVTMRRLVGEPSDLVLAAAAEIEERRSIQQEGRPPPR